MSRSLGIRVAVLTGCMVLGAVLIARAARSEPTAARLPFETFPLQIGEWNGQPTERLPAQVMDLLRVDEYVNRTYVPAGGRSAVGLYVGYYANQRQGQTLHSPLNCMPGAGWEPERRERLPLRVQVFDSGPARDVVVNRLVIRRGADRQVVLYWYQSHGRVEASEYWGKIYTVLDAIRLNRTDAAMVRIIAPVLGAEAADETAASELAIRFATRVFPVLGRFLPN